MIKIGDTNIMMSDSFEEKEQTVGNMAQMWIYVMIVMRYLIGR